MPKPFVKNGPPCITCGLQTARKTKTGYCSDCYIAYELPKHRHPQSKLLEFRSAAAARNEAVGDS